MKVKFNNSENFIQLTSYGMYSNKVDMTGEGIAENLSGFILYEDDETTVIRDCSDYKYKWNIYTEYENGIVLTNSETDREQEPIPLTRAQIEEELNILRMEKIEESKQLLSDHLQQHPILSSAHNNIPALYSVTLEKQALMTDRYMTYQMEKTVDPDTRLEWNETGKEYEEWKEEEFLQLMLEIKKYVYPLVSYQQAIEHQIRECKTQKELDNIHIDFEKDSTVNLCHFNSNNK